MAGSKGSNDAEGRHLGVRQGMRLCRAGRRRRGRGGCRYCGGGCRCCRGGCRCCRGGCRRGSGRCRRGLGTLGTRVAGRGIVDCRGRSRETRPAIEIEQQDRPVRRRARRAGARVRARLGRQCVRQVQTHRQIRIRSAGRGRDRGLRLFRPRRPGLRRIERRRNPAARFRRGGPRGRGFVRRSGVRHRCPGTRQGLDAALAARFLDEARKGKAVVVGPVRRRMSCVRSRSVVDASRRNEHADEVRGDSGIVRGQPERLDIVSLGGRVVGLESGGDRKSVRDPGRGRGVLCRRPSIAEVLCRGFRLALQERGASGPQQRLRPQRRLVRGALRRLQEAALGCGGIAALQCDVAESQQRLRSVVKAFREREVEPACNTELTGRQRGCRDRKTVREQLAGVGGRIVVRRPVGACDERGEDEADPGHPQAKRGRRLRRIRHASHPLHHIYLATS